MLTEFGGIAYEKFPTSGVQKIWRYSKVTGDKEFFDLYRQLLHVVNSTPIFSGFCYAKFVDTFQEAKGLLCAYRTPKIPMEQIRSATSR